MDPPAEATLPLQLTAAALVGTLPGAPHSAGCMADQDFTVRDSEAPVRAHRDFILLELARVVSHALPIFIGQALLEPFFVGIVSGGIVSGETGLIAIGIAFVTDASETSPSATVSVSIAVGVGADGHGGMPVTTTPGGIGGGITTPPTTRIVRATFKPQAR